MYEKGAVGWAPRPAAAPRLGLAGRAPRPRRPPGARCGRSPDTLPGELANHRGGFLRRRDNQRALQHVADACFNVEVPGPEPFGLHRPARRARPRTRASAEPHGGVAPFCKLSVCLVTCQRCSNSSQPFQALCSFSSTSKYNSRLSTFCKGGCSGNRV